VRALAVLALTGCTWVYDAQYDDRRDELVASRKNFLPTEANTKLIQSGQDKLFWVDVVEPLNQPVLHSYVPATDTKLDYTWSTDILMNVSDVTHTFTFGGQLVARCGIGSTKAFDAKVAGATAAMIDEGNDENCAVDGTAVYYLSGRDIKKWVPPATTTTVAVNLDAAGVGDMSVGGFGVIGNQVLVEEGGELWLVDLASGRGTWLENHDNVSGGTIFFDDKGVLYTTNKGLLYTAYADHSTFSMADAVSDGGYDLNISHDDAQAIPDGSNIELTMLGRHVIYRSKHGIFAYGLDTKKVVDLLLDQGDGFQDRPIYHFPTVTTDGTLFVEDTGTGFDKGPVYRVDLTGRLR
jgi:hypothetical protein